MQQSQVPEIAGLKPMVISEYLGEHWHVTNACHLVGPPLAVTHAPGSKSCRTSSDGYRMLVGRQSAEGWDWIFLPQHSRFAWLWQVDFCRAMKEGK
jgi:hypothetical protein